MERLKGKVHNTYPPIEFYIPTGEARESEGLLKG